MRLKSRAKSVGHPTHVLAFFAEPQLQPTRLSIRIAEAPIGS